VTVVHIREEVSLIHGAEPFLRSCQLCSHSRNSQQIRNNLVLPMFFVKSSGRDWKRQKHKRYTFFYMYLCQDLRMGPRILRETSINSTFITVKASSSSNARTPAVMMWFSSGCPVMCRVSTPNSVTAVSFHIRSNLLFIKSPCRSTPYNRRC
jgi:hypothetical protein